MYIGSTRVVTFRPPTTKVAYREARRRSVWSINGAKRAQPVATHGNRFAAHGKEGSAVRVRQRASIKSDGTGAPWVPALRAEYGDYGDYGTDYPRTTCGHRRSRRIRPTPSSPSSSTPTNWASYGVMYVLDDYVGSDVPPMPHQVAKNGGDLEGAR
jgi:hypothetical protein